MLTFSKAIELDPELADAHYNRAMVNLQVDQLIAAIEDMSAVIQLQPEAPRYYMERAQLYLIAGDGDRAIGDLEQVLSLARDERVTLAAKQLLAEMRRAVRP